MVLLSVTSATWIVTGLGFGIVLALLFCLVFILQGFGYIMQKATAPKEAPKSQPAPAANAQPAQADPKPAATSAAPAAPADDTVAIAMALYLAARDGKHDVPTAMIKAQARETAWNTKSYGLNNQGF